jgi:hypothetical protein
VRMVPVLAGVAGLLTLAACGAASTGDAASPSPSTTAGSTAAKADPAMLGPDGYGGIKLGATAAEVKAAGLEVSGDDTPCLGSADLKGPKGYASLLISKKYGVYVISARDPETTPEGIKLGSTLAEVKEAYPTMTDGFGHPATDDTSTRVAPAAGKATYQMYIKNGKVDSLELRLTDCTG